MPLPWKKKDKPSSVVAVKITPVGDLDAVRSSPKADEAKTAANGTAKTEPNPAPSPRLAPPTRPPPAAARSSPVESKKPLSLAASSSAPALAIQSFEKSTANNQVSHISAK
jgi:hypothetical protein